MRPPGLSGREVSLPDILEFTVQAGDVGVLQQTELACMKDGRITEDEAHNAICFLEKAIECIQ